MFIEGLPLLLRDLQSVPQLLDLLSVILTRRFILDFTFLQLQDQKNHIFVQLLLGGFYIQVQTFSIGILSWITWIFGQTYLADEQL